MAKPAQNMPASFSTTTGEEPPVASFTTNNSNFNVGGTLRTNNTSTGNVETWTWEVVDLDSNIVVATDESNYDLNYQFSTSGRYLVRLTVRNSGGDSQAESVEITVTAPDFECAINGSSSVYPGQPEVPYSANMNNVSGREIVTQSWRVLDSNGQTVMTGDGQQYRITWDVDSGDYTVIFNGELEDGATCEVSTQVTVTLPGLSCVINANNTALIPGEETTFTISIPYDVQQSWENITYNWAVSGDYQIVGGDLNSDSITVAWPEAGSFTVDGEINADDAPGAATCIVNYGVVEVGYSDLECRNPNGDNTPALDEVVTFRARQDNEIRNLDGRDYIVSWTLIDRDTGETVATGDGENFQFTFDVPGARYELTYTVSIDGVEECSRSRNVTVATERVICQSFGGESSPAYPDRNYTFRYNVDRGTTDIIHIWTLGGVSLGERNNNNSITVNSSTWASSVATGFSTVSVQVVDADDRNTVYCEGTRDITVGQLSVDFEITSTTEVEGGYEVCVDNTSSTQNNDLEAILNSVDWSWTFDRNNLGANPSTSTDYEPGCFLATELGEYRIRLEGSVSGGGGDLSGRRDRSVTFRAEDRINVTADVEAAEGPLTITFTADGENLVENTYIWSIDGAVFNRTGADQVSRFFASVNEETQYTITVSAEGETGNRIEASVVVTIYPAGGLLSANFSADRYGVAAGSQVCFTDQSTSNGPALTTWVWNFGDGSAPVTFDTGSYQGTVCHTYDEPGQSYEVSLSVTNAIEYTVSATNTIKTFSDFETSSTYEPVTPNGTCETKPSYFDRP